MANDVTIVLKGDKALFAALNALGTSAHKRVARPAIRKGASLVNKAAKNNIKPSTFDDSSGILRRSLGIKSKTYRTAVAAIIGARKGQSKVHRGVTRIPFFYSHLVEGGTSARSGHPGSEPKPFLEPAFESTKGKAEQVIKAEMRVQLEKEAVRQARKAMAKG